MPVLGSIDSDATHSVRSILGNSERELVSVWACELTDVGESEWLTLVNEVAQATPGTLAHRAMSDARMPEQFRVVAPSFKALGWRSVELGAVVTELGKTLTSALLGEGSVRNAQEAVAIVDAFIDLFGAFPHFLTNGADEESAQVSVRSTGEWAAACPLTPAIAESGVLALGNGRAGLLWVAES